MIGTIALAALLSTTAVDEAPGTTAAATATVTVALQAEQPATEPQFQSTTSGLPERPPPPRTLSEQWPVFALFVIVWSGIVLYVLTFGRRLRRAAVRLDAGRGTGVAP